MPSHEEFAFAVLGVLMRREGRDSIHVSYDELAAQPIQLVIEEGEDFSIIVSLPSPDEALTEQEIALYEQEACEAGQAITHAFPRNRRQQQQKMD
jgi:hypothetical protein